jgi:hypothetical protein
VTKTFTINNSGLTTLDAGGQVGIVGSYFTNGLTLLKQGGLGH